MFCVSTIMYNVDYDCQMSTDNIGLRLCSYTCVYKGAQECADICKVCQGEEFEIGSWSD